MMNVTNDLRVRGFILAGVMLSVCLSLIFVGIGSTFGAASSCPSSPASPCWAKVQSGTATCTIPAVGINNFQCNAVTTFSPSYSTAPYGQCILTGTTSFNNLGTSAITFLGTDPAKTWPNMPPSPTELFGTTSHEVEMIPSALSWDFQADVVNPSTNATAVLRPQYSTDGGATWNDWSTAGGADISIATAGFHSTGLIGTTPNAPVGTLVRLRVEGLNGGGVGDVPSFTNIALVQIEFVRDLTVTRTAISATSISCNARTAVPLGAATVVNLAWWAGIKA